MNRQEVLARLEIFEGSVPYMYRCTGGEVTAGVGHAITSSAEAVKLNWEIGVRQAAAPEVTADFEKVAAAPKGMPAPHYEGLTQCRLSAEDLQRIAATDIANFEAGLMAAFPQWDSYPEPVQQGLFDMGFNLGIGGLRKFARLLVAVQAENWETAAAECHRQGVSETRNQEIAALFRQAGKV